MDIIYIYTCICIFIAVLFYFHLPGIWSHLFPCFYLTVGSVFRFAQLFCCVLVVVEYAYSIVQLQTFVSVLSYSKERGWEGGRWQGGGHIHPYTTFSLTQLYQIVGHFSKHHICYSIIITYLCSTLDIPCSLFRTSPPMNLHSLLTPEQLDGLSGDMGNLSSPPFPRC